MLIRWFYNKTWSNSYELLRIKLIYYLRAVAEWKNEMSLEMVPSAQPVRGG